MGISRTARFIGWKARLRAISLCNKVFRTNIPKSKKKYNGKPILTREQGNELMYEKISSGEPFLAARFGSTELSTLVTFENKKNLDDKKSRVAMNSICNASGFFPNDAKLAPKFVETFKKAIATADMMGVWFNPLEDYMLEKYGNDIIYSRMTAMEPYYFGNPWSRALKGKKVLVIHPFEESIRAQYAKRELLFENKDTLPEFELITMKAVQTIAGEKDERFADWFEALEYMHEQTKKIDFDVAIIGCGAYGFPLAAMIKQDGKQAVHLGGATQIMFGVKGSRWNNIPEIKKLFNESWEFPLESETPKNAKSVEAACYWDNTKK